MRISIRSARGFTRTELLVTFGIVAVLAILVSLAIPPGPSGPLKKSQLIQCIINARQIQMATMAMATDGFVKKDSSLGLPGDLKAKGHIANLSDYVNLLVRNGYLNAGDLKVFSGPGFKPYQGTLSSGSNGVLVPAFAEENCAFKVYLVKKDDPGNTVFLATKNYTYNKPLDDPKAKPFGDKGFVVVHKDGSAMVLKKSQAQALPVVGKLLGGGTVESAENCLNPSPTAP